MISNKSITVYFLYLIPLLLFSQQNRNQMLLKTNETAGVCFQLQTLSPKTGSSKSYTMLAFPIEARYEHNRYVTYTLRYNMGHQSFDGNGFSSIGDLNIGVRVLSGEAMTYMGELTLPTGSEKLEFDEFVAVSAGRLPFINAPLIYGASGLSIKLGASYSRQVNEKTSVALGARYFMRGSYTPIKHGDKYNPSDEMMLAAGIDTGDKETIGFIGDLQIMIYSAEKVHGEKYAESGMGFSLSGTAYLSGFNIDLLYYKRGNSELSPSGEFEPPSIFSMKLAHRDVRDFLVPMQPYIGFMKTGDGTLVDGATLFLIGANLRDVMYNDFPMTPYFEIGFGKIGDESNTFGLKFGTNVAFQVY